MSIADYEEVLADHRRLVRELDVAMHGEAGAAKQASLCDLIGPAKKLRLDAERYRWLRENPELVIDDMDQSMLLSDTALDCTVDSARTKGGEGL